MTDQLDDDSGRELLRQIAGFFQTHGVPAYVVGGTVRDWLLGRSSLDLDLAVAGDALTLTRALADELDAAYVPLDIERATARVVLRRTEGTRRVGARQGGEQVGLRMMRQSALPRPYAYIDVAQLRGDTLAADLVERDFTVNAMAVRLEDAAAGRLDVIDLLGGRRDLRAGRLRATSESAFRDDPLRMLRAIRLAAELNFAIVPQTKAWIADHAHAIRAPAPERLRDELVRLFACPDTSSQIRLMDELGLLGPLLPELVAGKGVAQPSMHQWDVFEHSLMVVERVDRVLGVLELPSFGPAGQQPTPVDAAVEEVRSCLAPFAADLRAHLLAELVGGRQRFVLLKLLALLHDVGKAETRSVDEAGDVHFYGHEQVGAEMVAAILRRFHFGAREVQLGRTVTRHHPRPLWLAGADKVTNRAIYRFFRDTRKAGLDVVLLALADTLARGDEPPAAATWPVQLGITGRLLRAWFERRDSIVQPPPLVRGSDLIETFGLEPGPIVGELLEAIRETQVTGDVATRSEALELAGDWLAAKLGSRGAEEQGSRGAGGQGSGGAGEQGAGERGSGGAGGRGR
ncbi:MAG: HD domain-containing protein [Anaerolineae bacterium]